jgi:2-polyprenyl-3-methyl-5-hydroxy-6-metoxy-1,4-benzoquinol methylase
MAIRRYLLVPAGGKGEGMGHLMRCLSLARALGGKRAILTTFLDSRALSLLSELIGRRSSIMVTSNPRPTERWDLVLADKKNTSREELRFLSRLGPVVCLDEGGDARRIASYTIDAFPTPPGLSTANISSLGFLGLPRRVRRAPQLPPRKVLVSFGGEDRADLSGSFLRAVIAHSLIPSKALTVIQGPLFARRQWPQGITVLTGITDLHAVLGDYDLLVTHFGITALQAMAMGTPVILLNPSAYHRDLGRSLKMPDIGIGKPKPGVLSRLLANPPALRRALDRFAEMRTGMKENLAEYLLAMPGGSGPECPACGTGFGEVSARFPDRTYRRCGDCGIVYLESFSAHPEDYGRRYFFQEYKARYGRTYLEDFEAIRGQGLRRAKTILDLLVDGKEGTILDVGCAYGPFLDALRLTGFKAIGIDVSADAVRYVRETLGIPAIRSSWQSLGRERVSKGGLHGITFWYVLEHFRDLGTSLEKARSFLASGGVLAFSTPNGRGISARKSRHDFLLKSPSDHFSILSPRVVCGLLQRHGFEVKKILITGHHPERFPGLLGKAAQKNAFFSRIIAAVSRALGLGDTFEVYAVKGEAA